MNKIWIVALLLWGLTGCEKYYLSLRQVPIDVNYLASTHVGSPDPRQQDPPYGQKVVMQWVIPPRLLKQKPELIFTVIYRNHTEETRVYPIEDRTGSQIFSLLNEAYQEKKGVLTYRAEIRTAQGIYREWKHQLWVPLMTFTNPLDK